LEYLFNFLQEAKGVTHVDDVKPQYIKQFLMAMRAKGRTVNYFNDLLKAFKVFFKYAHAEGYTETLVTEKIQNAKKEKVIIRTFSENEMKRLVSFYNGNMYLDIRNKVIILLFVDTGIRLSELTGLTEEQIKHDYIIIKGKGEKERVVLKSPMLPKWLTKYLTVRKSYFQYKNVPPNISFTKNGKLLDSSPIAILENIAGVEGSKAPEGALAF